MITRRLRGRLNYVHRERGVTGGEWWNIAVADDGTRTLTANCEMHDDAVQRDVVYSVDSDFLPLDAFVRLAVAGVSQGSGWFRFTDGHVEAEGWTRQHGRFSQRVATAGRAQLFAPHPVQSDAWQTAAFVHPIQPGTQPSRQYFDRCFNPSPLPNGASGPMLSKTDKHIEFVANEDILVPAGRFSCGHYRIHARDYVEPLEIWVFGPDRILALCSWSLLNSRYELVHFEELGGAAVA